MVRRLLVLVATTVIVMMLGGAVAIASTVPDTTYLRVWPEYDDNQVYFLEAVQLSPETVLPAEVKVAVPKGAAVSWVGEMLAGDPSQDPQAVYKVNPKDDYDEVVFTLTKSRLGQVEAKWTGININGLDRVLTLDWTQRYESKKTIFEFREPSQASDVKLTPPAANVQAAGEGTKFYQSEPLSLAVGQKQSFQVTYKRSTNAPTVTGSQSQAQQPASPQGSTSQSYGLASFIVFAIVAAGFVFLIYSMKRKSAGVSDKDTSKGKAISNQGLGFGAKAIIAAIILFAAIIGYGVNNMAVQTSKGIPTGNSCEENVAYLQAGVDKYKETFGSYPTDLKQLLESKGGKGPFVETISLMCPTDKVPYVVVSGEVQQASE